MTPYKAGESTCPCLHRGTESPQFLPAKGGLPIAIGGRCLNQEIYNSRIPPYRLGPVPFSSIKYDTQIKPRNIQDTIKILQQIRVIMHTKVAFTVVLASSSLASAALMAEQEVRPRQTSNPGGPVQSLSSSASVTDAGATGVMSIQTDTSVSLSIQTDTVPGGDDSTVSPTPSSTESSTGLSSTTGSSETSSTPATTVSDAGAAPRETGFALAAAAAAGFIGAVAVL
ncbi:hypothetical protein F5Y04DRAFT_244250 [Hypomontagnella monticulosa]|nr:hypothetical protein F5Y04DRAFT_244250 [Hypomontagnella monticulosa]